MGVAVSGNIPRAAIAAACLRGIAFDEPLIQALARALYDRLDYVDRAEDWEALDASTREFYCGGVEAAISELLCHLAKLPESLPTTT